MKQLVADVQKVAPDQPIDQSVVAGYWSADLFLAAVQKAGKNLTSHRSRRPPTTSSRTRSPNTVGPTTFPAAHYAPTPCGRSCAVTAPRTRLGAVHVRESREGHPVAMHTLVVALIATLVSTSRGSARGSRPRRRARGGRDAHDRAGRRPRRGRPAGTAARISAPRRASSAPTARAGSAAARSPTPVRAP